MTAPAFVQKVGAYNSSGGTTAVTVGSDSTGSLAGFAPTAAGNALVLYTRSASGFDISSVADSKGNTWQVDQQGAGTGPRCCIASAVITSQLVAGDTITVTWSGTTGGAGQQVAVVELSGLDTTGGGLTVDKAASAAGSSSTLTVATPAATSDPDTMVISAIASGPTNDPYSIASADADSGGTWTNLGWPTSSETVGHPWTDLAYQVAAASSLFQAVWSASGSSYNWSGSIVAYKAAGSVTQPGVVQKVVDQPNTGTNISSLALPVSPAQAMTAGNALILWVRSSGGAYVTGVTDSGGNSWSVDSSGSHTGSDGNIASAVITAPLTSSDTITVTFSTTVTDVAAGAIEVKGLVTSGGALVPDQAATLHKVASPATVETAAAIAQQYEFAVTLCAQGSTQSSPSQTPAAADPDSGGTWTDLKLPSTASCADAAWQITTAVSKLAAAWSWSNLSSNNADLVLVSYKANPYTPPAQQADPGAFFAFFN